MRSKVLKEEENTTFELENNKNWEYKEVDIKRVVPNSYNPSVMYPEDEAMLGENIENYGFLQPIVVVPSERHGELIYEIVDGEHRFNELRALGEKTIPAIIVDPSIFDEKTRRFQNVRMNKIRGHFDIAKFNNLVKDLVDNYGVSFDTIIPELGFTDEDEFHQLVEDARKNVPRAARKDYDKAIRSNDINTLGDLHSLVERLWKKYGDTMPANWMILDFGQHRHLLISMKPSEIKLMVEKFQDCVECGYTVDSVISFLMSTLDLPEFISQNKEYLQPITEETGTSLYGLENDGEFVG